MSTRALLVVDVQPTFCEGGELPVDGGHRVAQDVASYVAAHRDRYDLVVTTQDWHIDPGEHFSDDPDFVNSWPVHGVAESENARLHPALADLDADVTITKGQYHHGYSGFDGTDADGRSLERVLREADVDAVDVVGLAESHCVKHTALDAVRSGFATTVLTDLTAPVSTELGEQARRELAAAGVELTPSTR
ncbi:MULTISPECIES: isochorismatase family protein [unclassified Isoptericola]|uniref:isochorismatase family protein n=1 Tax=unclassified Isoptericola TaxID=2623355 RepID=UPI002712BA5D|nr:MULTISPECIES: isochorismatase family protein [unclassified Isoptericola]MDO8144009.1 isochorismatase family protein [Isoptericola sp. 178]MDO8149425.1 isochorismatase family protein [Isoptericola sp. b515]MDO8152372.1 isochorismatase family protein [Isoptericola sp. b408]